MGAKEKSIFYKLIYVVLLYIKHRGCSSLDYSTTVDIIKELSDIVGIIVNPDDLIEYLRTLGLIVIHNGGVTKVNVVELHKVPNKDRYTGNILSYMIQLDDEVKDDYTYVLRYLKKVLKSC